MFRDTKSPDGKDLRKRLEEGQKRLSDCKSGEKVKIVSIDAGKGSKSVSYTHLTLPTN